MRRYDPLKAPPRDAWLAMDEQERIALVVAYHAKQRIRLPNPQAHALFHVIVENQLAEELHDAVEALERLIREGLDRHDAVHAIANVVVRHLHSILLNSVPKEDEQMRYLADLRVLTAASRRRDV